MYQRPSSLVFDRRNSLWRNLLCCVPFFGKGSPDLAYDLSRFKSHATLRNNPSYIVGDKLGIEVPDFTPASSQNARIPRGIFTWDGIVTLHFWFYLDAFPGGDTGLFDNQWGNDNSGGFQVLIQGSGGNMVSYAGDLTGRQGVGSGGLSTSKWFCYIFEADAINDTLTIWLNNEQVAQNTGFTKNTVDGGTSNAGSYRFFANSQENNYLDGKGFNVMIWDRRLTPSERKFLYSRPFGMYLPSKLNTFGYVPVTITPISVSDSGSGSEAVSLLSLINLIESGLGWDAIAPLLLLEQFESISGWDQDQGTWQVTNNELDPVSQNAPNWGGMVITKNVSYKDFDAYMRIKTPTDNKGVQFLFRTGSTEGSGYGLQLRLNDGNFRIENWGVANLNNVSFSYTNSVYYRVRVRVRGSNIKAKIWLDGSTEPTSWNIDFDDTTFPNAGKIGFSSEDSIAWYVDWLIIESYDVNILATIPVSDAGSGTDNFSLLALLGITDNGAGLDATIILNLISLADTATATDIISILAIIAIPESGASGEAISILAQIAITDSAAATEAISVIVNIIISDSGSLVSEAISALIVIAVSDTASSSEALSLLVSLAVQDSAVGSEIITIISSFLLDDSLIGIDTISIANNFTIADSGSSSELLSILSQIVLSDIGNSSEALSILAQVAVIDSANGVEALQILSNVSISDSGLASEALSILVDIAIPDTVVGNEALTLLINIALSETGISSEVINTLLISGLFTRDGQLSDKRTNLYNRLDTGLYNKK